MLRPRVRALGPSFAGLRAKRLVNDVFKIARLGPPITPTPPLVLVVGPAPGQSGGISSVMSYLESEFDREKFEVRFLDTLKSGRWSTVCRTVGAVFEAKVTRRSLIVHLNVSTRGSTYRKWIMSRICAFFRVPYLVHLHGSKYRTFYAGASRVVQVAVISLFRGATSVVVLGGVWRDFVASELGVPLHDIAVVPNGTPAPELDDAAGSQAPRPLRLVFSGRVSVAKGVADLLQAADGLYEESLRFELVLMGDSRDSALLQQATSRPYCMVTGWLPAGDVVRYLKESDVFVLPSHDEGLPMAMIEAMSLSLPVIVTDVGAISDVIVNGQEGYLVQVGDIEGLRTAMRSLLTDQALRAAMGLHARRRWTNELRASEMARGLEVQWHELVAHRA
jgi:glycosyltransferase involved in cell wall biosynthesis